MQYRCPGNIFICKLDYITYYYVGYELQRNDLRERISNAKTLISSLSQRQGCGFPFSTSRMHLKAHVNVFKRRKNSKINSDFRTLRIHRLFTLYGLSVTINDYYCNIISINITTVVRRRESDMCVYSNYGSLVYIAQYRIIGV